MNNFKEQRYHVNNKCRDGVLKLTLRNVFDNETITNYSQYTVIIQLH